MDKDRHIERKCKRFFARLKNSKGISCSSVPCCNIVLCNVGQATGFKKDEIVEILQKVPHIKLLKFIAEKGESHSFLVFDSVNGAKSFYNEFNGKAKAKKNETLIYMNYVDSVPSDETICSIDNPVGLHILENFITEEEEQLFFKVFDWIDDSNLKNRQVKHYGYEFRYGSNDVDIDAPLQEKIPEECDILWRKLKEYGFNIDAPDQLTVNKYNPGQGIPSHVDRHSPFGDTILSLSIGSSVLMDWKHHSGKYVPVVVPARSMLIMQNEARYDWQHGIQPRSWDPIVETRKDLETSKYVKVITGNTTPRGTRISLTFRKTRKGPCECNYKILCDSWTNNNEIDNKLASHLEDLHVHQVYDQISSHFSTTRHKPWPKVVEFLQDTPTGAIVMDLGAGNGKNIQRRNDIVQIAGERSAALVRSCAAAGALGVRLDVLHAPLTDRSADVVVCIAVIHHFCSEARRKRAVSTIARLLRPGGKALITVWAKDQRKSNYIAPNKDPSQDNVITTVGGLNLPVHENRTQFRHSDLLVPWKLRNVNDKKPGNDASATFLRYYHVFEEGELERLCDAPDLVIEKSFYEEGNWCVILRKI